MRYNCPMARGVQVHASPEPDVSAVAALIGDRARATMLAALFDGRELPASELAYRANLAPNAASAHLGKLVSGGLLRVRTSGRQRLFSLTSANVAHALEALTFIARPAKIVSLSQSRIAADLRLARSCYDHLAGQLGVAVTDALIDRGIIAPMRDSAYRLTVLGEAFFTQFGADLEKARDGRRHFARQCMDWSERRPHLAGALGAAFRKIALDEQWVKMKAGGRTLRITDRGRSELRAILSIEL